MRVLVTGATGFVGAHVARHLQARGYTVLATGRDQAKGERLGLPFTAARLDCAEEALSLCAGQDAVIHCAGLSSPWGSPADFERHNPVATANLLKAGLARFVYISSAGVYFQQDEKTEVEESAPLPQGPQHPYLQSKRRCEELLRPTEGWVVLRPRAVYGPGDSAILPRLVRLMRKGLLPVIGSGHSKASLTYVENLALASELALSGPTRTVFNITDPEPVELWPLLRRVAQELRLPPIRGRLPAPVAALLASLVEKVYARFLPGREPPITPYTLSLLYRSQTLDISKARAELGYRPLVTTEEGVLRTLQALGGQPKTPLT